MKNIKLIIPVLLVFFVAIAQGENRQMKMPDEDVQWVNDEINTYLQLSSSLVNKNLDSALYYARKANDLIEGLSSDFARIQVYQNLGDIYVAQGNFAASISYYYDAKHIIDKKLIDDPDDIQFLESHVSLLIKIGTSFFLQKNTEQALQNYDEALMFLEADKHIPEESKSNFKLRLFNNIGAIHIQHGRFDMAIQYYKSGLDLSIAAKDEVIEAAISNNLGICYMEKGDFAMANYYFERSLKIRQQLNDKRGIAQCYNNIGKNFALNKNFAQAKDYFLEALKLGQEIGNIESILNSLQSLSSIYADLGDYRNALETFREFTGLKDSLFNIESLNRIAQLEMQYKFENQAMLFDLELKRKETEQQKAKLIYFITGGSLFFLLLTAILLIYLQRSKIRNEKLHKAKLELEHRNISLEKQKLKEDLDFKNRELTTNVMYLLKKNELITGITEKLIKSKRGFRLENQKLIQEIINELKSNQDKDIWAEFEAHFTHVHTEFYSRLNELFPNLSSNEKKLCAFLRLNMSTKEISAITYQSVNSITVARHRLRGKLNIQGEEVDLINFLMSL